MNPTIQSFMLAALCALGAVLMCIGIVTRKRFTENANCAESATTKNTLIGSGAMLFAGALSAFCSYKRSITCDGHCYRNCLFIPITFFPILQWQFSE